ncbi:MAG: hypothetical protein QMD50_00650 [Patescibacteria group bacterium]|nr:hypothetical protein [Patescibacteria group bacterium]
MQELNIEQKTNLVDAWLSIVVDNEAKPNDLENWNNQKVKNWFYKTLMKGVSDLVDRWRLNLDDKLVESIRNEFNSDKKIKLELEYIELIRLRIDEFLKKHPVEDRSTKWDSWPKKMRGTKSFNCVGGTFIGLSLLEKARVTSYYGNPVSHVLNIIKLSNGEFVYADFTNNQVRKIKPEKVQIGNVDTLKLKDPEIIYRYIPLLDKKDSPSSILGNLNSLRHDALDDGVDPFDKKEAVSCFNVFEEEFKKNNFAELRDRFYPSGVTLRRSEEMRGEEERIDKIQELNKRSKEYLLTLGSKQASLVRNEIKNNSEAVKRFLMEDNIQILGLFTLEAKKVLELIKEDLTSIKKENSKLFHDFIDWMISK